MFRNKMDYLKQIYRMDTDNNSFIIEVSLDNYKEIFDGWDPSPVKRRDLDPELIHFLDECASDIPLKYSLELCFYLPKEQYDEEKEKLARLGIENNFRFIIHFINKEMRQISSKIVFYVIAAFAFLSAGYLSGEKVAENIVTTILMEGLSIGGWVFLWEAFSLFFFSRQEVRSRLKKYRRFQEAKVSFNYR